MKKNKTAKRSRNFQRSKRIGGILDINTLVPAVNNLRYLVWNTIPDGTLVLYINPVNPQHYGIYVVRGGPSPFLSFYTLVNTLQPNNTLICSSDNFRIIVQISNTINYDTGAQISNRRFYGLITGYGTNGTHGGIYVTGLDNNNLIYNTYVLNGQNLSSSITVITYDDINPNRAGTIDISHGETLNLFNTMANYITGGGNDERRNQLIDLRILNDQGQWIIPNYEDAQDTPPVQGFNFGRTPGRPLRGPQGGPQNIHQDQGISNRWLAESEGQANPGAAFGNYAARASYGPPVEESVGESVFDRARRRHAEERQRGQLVENREQEPIVNREERLDDWIEEQNQIIVEDLKRNPVTGRIIPAVRRPKTDSEKRNEQKVANDLKKELLEGIKNGSNDDKICPICQNTFAELSSEPAPYNEIYSCKNIHPICGHCKNIMDMRPSKDGYLWAHTTPVWKCIVCNNVSRNADRLEDFEEAYKKSQDKSSKSGGSSTTMYKNVGKKEILGTTRIIYKMKGSNKEYVKDKGMFIHVTEYKKLKSKNKKK
jgi:hypothetical protein